MTPGNPYDNPKFATDYVRNQADLSRNSYEWRVSHPALLQFIGPETKGVLDYGTGSGIFAADMARLVQTYEDSINVTATDSSSAVLDYANLIGHEVSNLTVQRWDAQEEPLKTLSHPVDRIFAKLVFNYLSPDALRESVFPRMFDLLDDDGLLIVALPNPTREANYNYQEYTSRTTNDIAVGGFGAEVAATTYHHTHESLEAYGQAAGFKYAEYRSLPQVRFEQHKRRLLGAPTVSTMIAHPMPLVPGYNNAKRWVYIFGKGNECVDSMQSSIERFDAWLAYTFPEIADIASIHIPPGNNNSGEMLPFDNRNQSTIYIYGYPNGRSISVDGSFAENLSPKQRQRLVRRLSRAGLR